MCGSTLCYLCLISFYLFTTIVASLATFQLKVIVAVEFLALYFPLDGNVEQAQTTISECLLSVGKVYCGFQIFDTATADLTDTKLEASAGACVIYQMDEDYTYFLTNYHVVYDSLGAYTTISDEIICYLYGSESAPSKKTVGDTTHLDGGEYGISCEYIGGALTCELAVLRAETAAVALTSVVMFALGELGE